MGCGASSGKYQPRTETVPAGPASGAIHVDNPGKLDSFYTVGKQLGSGGYSYVCEAISNSSGEEFAVQVIAKSNVKSATRLNEELTILKMLDHTNICKLCDSFEDHRNIYLIFELCRGGDLFSRVLKPGKIFEVEAAFVMKALFEAIEYMHSRHVCHLDIKPQNMLFSTDAPISQSEESATLKLIDFDNACQYEEGKRVDFSKGPPYFLEPEKATNPAGLEYRQNDVAQQTAASRLLHARSVQAYYVAPEVVWSRRGYTQAADLWSAGVIMHILLTGLPPFCGDSDAEVLDAAERKELVFDAFQWKTITDEAKFLVECLLKKDAKKRWSATDALKSSWIQNRTIFTDLPPIDDSVLQNLQNFWSHNSLKKAALHYLSCHVDASQIQTLADSFQALDTNGDGTLSKEELKTGFSCLQVTPDFQAILAGVTSSDAGRIDYKDFLAATLNRQEYMTQETLWKAFRSFDSDGSGYLSKDELLISAKKGEFTEASKLDLASFIEKTDANGDGKISFKEFVSMMREGSD